MRIFGPGAPLPLEEIVTILIMPIYLELCHNYRLRQNVFWPEYLVFIKFMTRDVKKIPFSGSPRSISLSTRTRFPPCAISSTWAPTPASLASGARRKGPRCSLQSPRSTSSWWPSCKSTWEREKTRTTVRIV